MPASLLVYGYLLSGKDKDKILDTIVNFYKNLGCNCTLKSSLPPKVIEPRKPPAQLPGGVNNISDEWMKYYKDSRKYNSDYRKYNNMKFNHNIKIEGTALTLHCFMFKKMHYFLCWGDNYKQHNKHGSNTLIKLSVVDFNTINIPEYLEVIEAVENKKVTMDDLNYYSIVRA